MTDAERIALLRMDLADAIRDGLHHQAFDTRVELEAALKRADRNRKTQRWTRSLPMRQPSRSR